MLKNIFGTVCLAGLLAGGLLAEKLENKAAFYNAIALIPAAIAGSQYDESRPILIGTERMTIAVGAASTYTATITVPSDCTFVVIGYAHRHNNATNTINSTTLNGIGVDDAGAPHSSRSQLTNRMMTHMAAWPTSKVGTGSMTFSCTNSANFSSACGYVWYFKNVGGILSCAAPKGTFGNLPENYAAWSGSAQSLTCVLRPSSRYSYICAAASYAYGSAPTWSGTNLNINDTQTHSGTTDYAFASNATLDAKDGDTTNFTLSTGGATSQFMMMGMIEVLGMPNGIPVYHSTGRYDFQSVESPVPTTNGQFTAELGPPVPSGKDRILILGIATTTNLTSIVNVKVGGAEVPSSQIIYGRGNATTDWSANNNMALAYVTYNSNVSNVACEVNWTVPCNMLIYGGVIIGPSQNTPIYSYNVTTVPATPATYTTQGFQTIKNGITLIHYTAFSGAQNSWLSSANSSGLMPTIIGGAWSRSDQVNNRNMFYILNNNVRESDTVYFVANSSANISKTLIVTTWR